ncbi:MAG: RNA polymerase sigma factor [Cytophagaceae bacterium]|jgi:RNA polymerase sigma-70 factor (ECF subfamily)|nr:RNA polymerase sigma factor [Cytophagaceae bacterium]
MKKEELFNEIVRSNSERIKRICSYYCSNDDDVKDIFQEILINVWKSLDRFRGDSAVSTYIYRIAVNTALGYTGKAFRKMKLTVSTDTVNLDTITDDDESNITEQRLEKLQDELNRLSVIDKMLISLTLEGLTMKEIADIAGITEPNVKVKIHRIKTQLRTNLKKDDYDN